MHVPKAYREPPMKSEVLIFLALAAALTFHRRPQGSGCGPSGCLLLPPDFQKSVETVRAGESTRQSADRGWIR